jgi:hypothetical protein
MVHHAALPIGNRTVLIRALGAIAVANDDLAEHGIDDAPGTSVAMKTATKRDSNTQRIKREHKENHNLIRARPTLHRVETIL